MFADDVISEAGQHQAFLVDRLIFDNHNPNGALPLNWFNDIHAGSPVKPLNIPLKIKVVRIGN